LAAALRGVLAPFHEAKGSASVSALLVRLHEPLLFRGLAAPNPAVRLNALELLLAAFPLSVSRVQANSPRMHWQPCVLLPQAAGAAVLDWGPPADFQMLPPTGIAQECSAHAAGMPGAPPSHVALLFAMLPLINHDPITLSSQGMD
jgi:hypothetical protein